MIYSQEQQVEEQKVIKKLLAVWLKKQDTIPKAKQVIKIVERSRKKQKHHLR